LSREQNRPYNKDNIIVGTTRWVAEDPTGDTVGLAKLIDNVPLVATELSFKDSKYPQLRCYEEGFVKEGVGAGGSAIAASLSYDWGQSELLTAIEDLVSQWLNY
jgi:NaMN:DMB phosphoribosyltransferase